VNWWDGQPFDAILLDAPCTASGIVRRHPDVRWLRRPTDIAQLAAIQARLLAALWPLLKPGGRCCTAPARCFGPRASSRFKRLLRTTPMPFAAVARPFNAPIRGKRQPRPGQSAR
jgi:16S rRNA (cytosine967-C5)-methyltransferase